MSTDTLLCFETLQDSRMVFEYRYSNRVSIPKSSNQIQVILFVLYCQTLVTQSVIFIPYHLLGCVSLLWAKLYHL
ncbi:hypothetical protein GQ457_04G028410 [Hibiscus cannabinus]